LSNQLIILKNVKFYLGKYLSQTLSLSVAVLLLSMGCNRIPLQNAQTEIDSISFKWVPDKRVGICEVSLANRKKETIILRGETTSVLAKQDIINTLSNHGIKLIDSIIILPDTINNQRFLGLATLSVINLRKNPEHSAELISQAILGTPVRILKEENSWLLIQTPDQYIAWTEKTSVRMMSRSEISTWKINYRVIFIKNTGWIYSRPTENSEVIGDIVGGCIVEKTGESDGYIEIRIPDGRKGFVIKEATMNFSIFRNNKIYDADIIVKYASTLLDCSGFVQTVYFMNGILLMRDASLQALHGYPVDISDGFSQLKKGDLLFFGSVRNSKPHVTHVAIYTGNSDYINSSGRVMINSLDSLKAGFVKYRLSSLLSARRIIGGENDPGIVPLWKHNWY
jgi:SH3-like domain-containing protein